MDGHLRLVVHGASLRHLERDVAFLAERIAVDAVSVRQLHVQRNMIVLDVSADAEDIFYEVGDGRQSGPSHEVLACHKAGRSALRCIIFPERTGLLIYVQHVVIVIHDDVVGKTSVAFIDKT